MKVVILAGGLGTRIAEETVTKPKPMVEIGAKPILWHIMKIYSHFGYNDFIFCLGYKGYMIKEYFANYFLHTSDVTFDMTSNRMEVHQNFSEPWKVTLIDTGTETMTGGRLKRIEHLIGNNPFMMTYGDILSDINIEKLIEHHKKHQKIVTLTAVQPAGRFGHLNFEDKKELEIKSFHEKPAGDKSWINGGFFVLEPTIFNYLENDKTIFEQEPLKKIASERNLIAYKHQGFWHPMDTLRDKIKLDEIWNSGNAPWNMWDNRTSRAIRLKAKFIRQNDHTTR